jgi:hypothetical protein
MSQNNDSFNPFDPAGVFKEMRDAGMDSWSKIMLQMVHTEAGARGMGTALDAWLTASVPFKKATEAALLQALAALQMPSRAEIMSLAERLTHIETRLDDLDAKLDEVLRVRKPAGKAKSNSGEKL